jgi:hypothetical protein
MGGGKSSIPLAHAVRAARAAVGTGDFALTFLGGAVGLGGQGRDLYADGERG